MSKNLTTLLSVLLLSVIAAPAAAMTADEVIAKHVAARGGDGWKQIESIQLSGSYTAFSKIGPFTVTRKLGDRYRIDCHWNEHPVKIGYDGKEGWMVNPMFGNTTPQKLGGIDHQVLLQDIEMATPFFTYADRGYEVELLDKGDLDGEEMLRLRLSRPDGFEEIWYLDPETYLETARDSPGSDFGTPADQRTYFDDFRQVAGVTVPYYVETQWYTRTRIMEVDSVEIDIEVDDAIFRKPAPPGMDKLLLMVGDWHVKTEQRPQPGAPLIEGEREATITSDFGGATVRERLTTSRGTEIEVTWAYDRFKEYWVRASINDFTNHLDVQQGTMDDEGRLTLSNVETGTEWTGFGRTFHSRTSLFDVTEDGFTVEQETSLDGGENWFVNAKETYTRKTE